MSRYIGLDAHASSCTLGVMTPSVQRIGLHVVETNARYLIEAVRQIPQPRHSWMSHPPGLPQPAFDVASCPARGRHCAPPADSRRLHALHEKAPAADDGCWGMGAAGVEPGEQRRVSNYLQ